MSDTNRPAKPTVIHRHVDESLLRTLEMLTERALSGEIVGLDFVAKSDEHNFITGITGDAINHPADMLRPTEKLLQTLQKYIDDNEVVQEYIAPSNVN